MAETVIAQSLPDLSHDSAAQARRLVRTAWKATLATIDRESGHPYASLVAVATDPAGSPLLLLSDLAEHTRNLARDKRASLLFDGTAGGPDALTGPRVTLIGTLDVTTSEIARRRYLARHTAATDYIDFGDFNLWRLVPDRGHIVAGFGRIARIPADGLQTPVDDAEALVAAESEIVAHMNADHADACATLATELAGARNGHWAMTGCDPAGYDLVCSAQSVRLDFPHRVTTPDAFRKALIEMLSGARAGSGGR